MKWITLQTIFVLRYLFESHTDSNGNRYFKGLYSSLEKNTTYHWKPPTILQEDFTYNSTVGVEKIIQKNLYQHLLWRYQNSRILWVSQQLIWWVAVHWLCDKLICFNLILETVFSGKKCATLSSLTLHCHLHPLQACSGWRWFDVGEKVKKIPMYW